MTDPHPRKSRLTTVVQGEFRVSDDPEEEFSTILGSCVAVCLHDPVLRMGGMNHFLLPFGDDRGEDRPVRYGLFAMELLINALMKKGASKARLQAKIFGGAKIVSELRNVGASNATFAREFLQTERIECLAQHVGGTNTRRVIFCPATGAARMMLIPLSAAPREELPRHPEHPLPSPAIDLF